MTITAHIGSTKTGGAVAELRDGDVLVLKAYASADERRIRIVLPELCNYKQTLVDPDSHFLEFSRDADSALPNASRAPLVASNVKCSVLACKNTAAFIIDKIAYCEKHRSVADGV